MNSLEYRGGTIQTEEAIGERIQPASEVPRVTLNTSFDATEIMALRKKLRQTSLRRACRNYPERYGDSAVAHLPGYPELNVLMTENAIFKNAVGGVDTDGV